MWVDEMRMLGVRGWAMCTTVRLRVAEVVDAKLYVHVYGWALLYRREVYLNSERSW